MPDIARQWFIPGDGIDRHVISADIQRYLGNDATVRPGQGTGSDQGISGYWIKAYRNLTSAMISDLRADSARWRQEQRSTGTRGSYEQSSTYNQSSAGRVQRRDADSPAMDTSYSNMSSGRERMTMDRRAQPVDAMQIDPPAPQSDRRGFGQPARGGYPDARGFGQTQDSRNYGQDAMMQDAYDRPPVTSSFGSDARYAPAFGSQTNNAGMSSFGRQPPQQGNYYPTAVTSSYDMPTMSGRAPDMSRNQGAGYGQPQQSGRQDYHRDSRDQRPDPRNPRYDGRGYDPSDAYPSPAATVSSMNVRDREPVTTSSNQSMYQQQAYQPDPFGGSRTMNMSGSVPAGYSGTSGRDHGRDRPPPSSGDARDARRRRH